MYAVIIASLYRAGPLPLLAAQSCECAAILRAEPPLVAAFMTNTVSIGACRSRGGADCGVVVVVDSACYCGRLADKVLFTSLGRTGRALPLIGRLSVGCY